MNTPNRFDVHTAIAALIADSQAEDWRDHAEVIGRFATSMPESGPVQYKHRSRTVTERVEGSDDGEEAWRVPTAEPVVREWSFGISEVRIGIYSLVRNSTYVTIRMAEEQNSTCYMLRFDKQGRPRDFGIEERDSLCSFTLFSTFYQFSIKYTRILTDKGGRWGWCLSQEETSPPP